MKKKLILLLLIMCFIPVVKAVTADGGPRNEKIYGERFVLTSEIQPSTYVIGKYMYTRNPHSGYDGALTTKRIMQASKSLNYTQGNDIYYKKVDGTWIDALTGNEVTVPQYFVIQNVDSEEVLTKPELDCNFRLLTKVSCASSIYAYDSSLLTPMAKLLTIDGSKVIFDGENNLENYHVEYYVLKNSDGTIASSDATYTLGKFVGKNNEEFTPTLIDLSSYEFDSHELQQIVSRFYYTYDDLKVYSDYSNIQTNGAYAVLGLGSTSVRIDAVINENYDVNLVSNLGIIGAGINSEVNFYNVKFKLGNVDTTKYMIRNYEVYSSVNAMDAYFDYKMAGNDLANIEGSSATYDYLFVEEAAASKYTTPHRLQGGKVDIYMIAHVNGHTVFGDNSDASGIAALSKRIYIAADVDDDASREIIAKATICNLDQSHCYEIKPYISLETGNQSYVR